jgi:hypothetical protein
MAAEPGCASCLDTLALLLFQFGRHHDAVDAQERAGRCPPSAACRKT